MKYSELEKKQIRDLVDKASSHSPLPGMKNCYLYSTLHLTVPVGNLRHETVCLTRKIIAETAHDMTNEEQGAVEFFSNLIVFILSDGTYVEKEIYAEDEDAYDMVIGKSFVPINRERLGFPRIYSVGHEIRLDITKDQE
jgi:hypothetical protein